MRNSILHRELNKNAPSNNEELVIVLHDRYFRQARPSNDFMKVTQLFRFPNLSFFLFLIDTKYSYLLPHLAAN